MTRYIGHLLLRAADETRRDGAVSAHTQSLLAEEGYLLSALEDDVAAILADRAH